MLRASQHQTRTAMLFILSIAATGLPTSNPKSATVVVTRASTDDASINAVPTFSASLGGRKVQSRPWQPCERFTKHARHPKWSVQSVCGPTIRRVGELGALPSGYRFGRKRTGPRGMSQPPHSSSSKRGVLQSAWNGRAQCAFSVGTDLARLLLEVLGTTLAVDAPLVVLVVFELVLVVLVDRLAFFTTQIYEHNV